MLNYEKTIRYTTTIPSSYLEELNKLTKENKIPSINYKIRHAIEEYIKCEKKREYNEMMKQASKDKSFIERTEKCLNEFKSLDSDMNK